MSQAEAKRCDPLIQAPTVWRLCEKCRREYADTLECPECARRSSSWPEFTAGGFTPAFNVPRYREPE